MILNTESHCLTHHIEFNVVSLLNRWILNHCIPTVCSVATVSV